jgi:hypothetical protein
MVFSWFYEVLEPVARIWMLPGSTELIVMLFLATSSAADFSNPFTPVFDAQ